MRNYNESNPIIDTGELVFNLLILNTLWFVCSIPCVTVGASATALNYTCIKMNRDEGDSIVKMFFRSYAHNIRQAVIIGTFMIATLIVIVGCIIQVVGMVNAGQQLALLWLVILVALLLTWMVLYTYIFMFLSRFENTIYRTVMNAIYYSIHEFSTTITILALEVLMFILIPLILWNISLYLFPIIIFFNMSLTTYIIAKIFNNMFNKILQKSNAVDKAQTC